MSENPTKLGTRCECRDDVPDDGKFGFQHRGHNCDRDAVRVVTLYDLMDEHYDLSVPMCAACADFHEGKEPV